MTILSFDPATTCGWCAYEDLGRDRNPRIECGSFTAKGDTEARLFAEAAIRVREILERFQPRRVALEMRMTSQAGIQVPVKGDLLGATRFQTMRPDASVKRQDGLRAIILSQLGMKRPSWGLPAGIPYEEPAVQTWRKSFFGEGFGPPASVPKDKRRAWWKKEARMKAELLGLKLGFTVPNDDAAEAVGIAMWLAAREGHFAARDAVRARRAA